MATQRKIQPTQGPVMVMAHSAAQLYYQPRISTRTSQIVGIEALNCIQHRKGTPARSATTARQHNPLDPLSAEQILRQACTQTGYWVAAGHHQLRVAIPLSQGQLNQQNLPAQIAAILKESKLAAKHLELEIPESALIKEIDKLYRLTHQLTDMGVSIAITNFGSSYSSIFCLERLPIQTLKIDRELITGLGYNQESNAIVSAIIAMADNLGLATLADGVEIKEQAEFLRREGCDQIQGPFHSHNLSAGELTEMLDLYRIIDSNNTATKGTKRHP